MKCLELKVVIPVSRMVSLAGPPINLRAKATSENWSRAGINTPNIRMGRRSLVVRRTIRSN